MTQSTDSFGSWLNLGTLILTKEYQRSFASIVTNNRYRITYLYDPLVLNQYKVKGFRIHLRNVVSDGTNDMFSPPIKLYPKTDIETISFPLDKDIPIEENNFLLKYIEAKYYYRYNVYLPNDIGSLCSVKIECMI